MGPLGGRVRGVIMVDRVYMLLSSAYNSVPIIRHIFSDEDDVLLVQGASALPKDIHSDEMMNSSLEISRTPFSIRLLILGRHGFRSGW